MRWRVHSFDVGTRNIAVCSASLLGGRRVEVERWEVADLGSNRAGIPHLLAWLDALDLREADCVYVENQIGARMKMLQHAIATYFHIKTPGAAVSFVPPRRKMMEQVGRLGTYRERKKFATSRTERIVFADNANPHDGWYRGHAKRDDLADAFLQMWAQLLHEGRICQGATVWMWPQTQQGAVCLALALALPVAPVGQVLMYNPEDVGSVARVFCARHHVGPNRSHDYYFMGQDLLASMKDVVARVEAANGGASAKDAELLRGAGVPFLTDASVEKRTFLDGEIFADDKVGIVARKIGARVPGRLYCWVDAEPRDRVTHCDRLARNILRGRQQVASQEAAEVLRDLYGVDPPRWPHSKMDHLELYDAISTYMDSENPRRVPVGVLFELATELSFGHLFPADPTRFEARFVPASPLSCNDTTLMLLESFDLAEDVVHFVTDTLVPAGLTPLYFPPQMQKYRSDSVPYDDRAYGSVLRKMPVAQIGYVRKLYAIVPPIGQPRHPLKLPALFDAFAPDADCPLIKLRMAGTINYKVSQSALRAVPAPIVRAWEMEPPSRNDAIVFKVFYGDFFATLLLFSSLRYDVKVTSLVQQHMTTAVIEARVLPSVRAVLARVTTLLEVSTSLRGARLRPLQARDLGPSNVRELQCSAMVEYGASLPPLETLQRRLLEAPFLFHRLYATQTQGGGASFKYKRVDDYDPVQDVRAFVSARAGMQAEKLVRAVAAAFQLRPEQAAGIVAEFRGQETDPQQRLFRSYTGCTVTLQRPNDIHIRVHVRGEHMDAAMASHVMLLVATVARYGVEAPVRRRQVDRGSVLVDAVVNREASLFEDASAPIDEARRGFVDDDPEEDDEDWSPQEAPEPGTGTTNVRRYALMRLQQADPTLFGSGLNDKNYRSFATMCGANISRQPMVVPTAGVAANLAAYPGSMPNHLAFGSTRALAEQNTYVCPSVFCSKSQVAMTTAQHAAKGCPDPTDVAIRGNPRYTRVGFLAPARHSKGLCVPCCFGVDHAARSSGVLRRRYDRCTQAQGPTGNAADASDTYVRGLAFPLDEGRRGRLPPSLARLLGPDYVRLGIRQDNRHLLACLAFQLGLAGGADQLLALVRERLQVHEFLRLGNSDLWTVFADPRVDVRDGDTYARFRGWFLEQREYAELYSLGRLVERVRASPRAVPSDVAVEAQREAVVASAMQGFLSYLEAGGARQHQQLLEMACLKLPWLNPSGLDILLFEHVEEEVYVVCMKHVTPMEQRGDRVAMIVKHLEFYEPVVRGDQSSFPSASLTEVLRFRDGNCKGILGDVSLRERLAVEGIMASVGAPVAFQVLDAGFRVVGVLSDGGVYVPLRLPSRVLGGSRCLHGCDLGARLPKRPPAWGPVFARLSSMPFYRVAEEHGGLLMGDGETWAPLDARGAARLAYPVKDAQIFAGWGLPNPAYDFAARWNMRRTSLLGHSNLIMKRILADPRLLREMDFLRYQKNPLGRSARLTLAEGLVRRTNANVVGDDTVTQLADMLLTRDVSALLGYVGAAGDEAILLTQSEVERGALRELAGDQAARQEVQEVWVRQPGQPTAANPLAAEREHVTPPKIAALFPEHSAIPVGLLDLFQWLAKQQATRLRAACRTALLDEEGDRSLLPLHPSFGVGVDTEDLGRTAAVMDAPDYAPGVAEARVLSRMADLSLVVVGTSKDLAAGSPAVLYFPSDGDRLVVLHYTRDAVSFRVLVHDATSEVVMAASRLREYGVEWSP